MYLRIFFYCCLFFILISTASASQLQEDPNYKELLSRYGTMANMKSIFTSVSPKEHLLTDPYIHNEKLTYQVKVFSKKSGNENFTQTVQTNFYDNKFYIVKVDIFNKKKDFMNLTTIYKNDFLPLILNYREGDNNTLHSEDFILWDWTENYRFKKSIRMKSPNYTKMKYDITSKVAFDKPIYDVYLVLSGLIRSFPFKNTDSIKIDISIPMTDTTIIIKVIDEETVTVPAGTFLCYKLEVKPKLNFFMAILARLLYGDQTNYFWVTLDTPHTIVKTDEKLMGGQFERDLIKIER